MKKILFSVLGLSLFFVLNTAVSYAVDLRSGDNLVIRDPVFNDLYLFSGNVSVQNDVYGDVYVMGGMVTIDGNISEDLVVLGGKVTVFGDVGDDVRVVGGQVSIYSNVVDELVVLGGHIDLGPRSVIGGNVLVSGGIANVDGKIHGDLRGNLSALIINGEIWGNVNVTIDNIVSVSEDALIMGNFVYRKLLESTIPQNAVKGNIEHREYTTTQKDDKDGSFGILFFAMKIFSLSNALLLTLLLVLICPRYLEKTTSLAKENLMKTFAVGLLTVILVVVGSLILVFTVFGVHLALIIMFVFGALVYLAKVFTSALLASYIVDFKNKKYLRIKMFFAILLALLVYYLLGMTPYLGGLFKFILFLLGLGSIILSKQYYFVYLRDKKQI